MTSPKKTPGLEPDNHEQYQRFIEAAKRVGVGRETKRAFEKAIDKILKNGKKKVG